MAPRPGPLDTRAPFPTVAESTAVRPEVGSGQAVLPERPAMSLSPSRAGDFLSCPLRYRLRVIDRIPEPPGIEATRGTLVHAVLERLFDVAPRERTPTYAESLIAPEWQRLTEDAPELAGLLFGDSESWDRWIREAEVTDPDPTAQAGFLADCTSFLARYFALEDPSLLAPAEREFPVSTELPNGLMLRGIIDRLDRTPNGDLRVVDYKTGRSPGPGWEATALFQMRFYGLVLWRTTGMIPRRLQLLYLSNGERLSIDPTEDELLATQRKVEAIWAAIDRATRNGQWPARKSSLCGWCSFQGLCPQWDGTPPPLPGGDPSGAE